MRALDTKTMVIAKLRKRIVRKNALIRQLDSAFADISAIANSNTATDFASQTASAARKVIAAHRKEA